MDFFSMPEIIWEAVALTLLPQLGAMATCPLSYDYLDSTWLPLKKPTWMPPPSFFCIVWTILYICMGYASYLVWHEGQEENQAWLPLTLYAIQLLLNWAWPVIFYRAQKFDWAFYVFVLMTLIIAACIFTFYPVSPIAAYFMVPYLAWMIFASAFSFTIWRLNPSSPSNKGSPKLNGKAAAGPNKKKNKSKS